MCQCPRMESKKPQENKCYKEKILDLLMKPYHLAYRVPEEIGNSGVGQAGVRHTTKTTATKPWGLARVSSRGER